MNQHTPLPDTAEPALRVLPSNIEAEQAVLGAVLVNNEALDRLSAFLTTEHFYDPVLGRGISPTRRNPQTILPRRNNACIPSLKKGASRAGSRISAGS